MGECGEEEWMFHGETLGEEEGIMEMENNILFEKVFKFGNPSLCQLASQKFSCSGPCSSWADRKSS